MKYDPAQDHESLFELDAATAGAREGTTGAAAKALRSVTRAKCPECATDKPVGIVRQAGHLVWRLHERTTLSGARMLCRASGVCVSLAEPVKLAGITSPACPCGGA